MEIIFVVVSIIFVVTTVLKDRKDYFKWSNKS
jgi:hypothetical protein